MELRINSIDYSGSIVDGPGIRTVLFVQGCDKRCKGCHNPSTWRHDKGKLVIISQLVEELKLKCYNKKLTISGGEPLLQYSAILKLVKQLKHFDIALYTGFEFHDIPDEILKYLDYIKIGSYEQNLRTTIAPFIGSTNQKFITLSE